MKFEVIYCDDGKSTLHFYPQIKDFDYSTKEAVREKSVRRNKVVEHYQKLFVNIDSIEEMVNFITSIGTDILLHKNEEGDIEGNVYLEIYDGYIE